MADNGYIWKDARVSFPDWQGTAQLDYRITTPNTVLARVVGLDPDEWQVVGWNIGGGERRHHLNVIAIPVRDLEAGVLSEAAVEQGDELRVTEFAIHDVDPYEILKQITHVFEMKMRSRNVVGRTIRVVAQGDVPQQLPTETG